MFVHNTRNTGRVAIKSRECCRDESLLWPQTELRMEMLRREKAQRMDSQASFGWQVELEALLACAAFAQRAWEVFEIDGLAMLKRVVEEQGRSGFVVEDFRQIRKAIDGAYAAARE